MHNMNDTKMDILPSVFKICICILRLLLYMQLNICTSGWYMHFLNLDTYLLTKYYDLLL